jgi:hypothetical protein
VQRSTQVFDRASMRGMLFAALTVTLPMLGEANDQYNYGSGGQSIGTVNDGVHNDNRQYHSYTTPAPRKPKLEDRLPPGFSVDKSGFVLNTEGNRICQTTSIPHITQGPSSTSWYWNHRTTCKMWDGSWSEGSGWGVEYGESSKAAKGTASRSGMDKVDEWLGLDRNK